MAELKVQSQASQAVDAAASEYQRASALRMVAASEANLKAYKAADAAYSAAWVAFHESRSKKP